MPCYRCATRQEDPARGASPWKRGVISGQQVLVCPECQRRSGWTAELDRCASCGSTALVRVLGETTCRACHATGEPVPGPESASAPAAPAGPVVSADGSGLADEVAAAIERLLRKPGDE